MSEHGRFSQNPDGDDRRKTRGGTLGRIYSTSLAIHAPHQEAHSRCDLHPHHSRWPRCGGLSGPELREYTPPHGGPSSPLSGLARLGLGGDPNSTTRLRPSWDPYIASPATI